MNREIKFRAWTTEKQSRYLPNRMWSWEEILDERIADAWKLEKMIWSEDDKIVLMQYTGLKDKNGRDVFEGDIVEYIDDKGTSVEKKGTDKVWWNEKESAFYGGVRQETWDGAYVRDSENMEVIGNVFVNPELL